MDGSPPATFAALTARFRDLWPEDWRDSVVFERLPGALLIRFGDAHQTHSLEVRHKHLNPKAFRAGQEIAFSYRPSSGGTPPVARYAEVIDRLLLHEEELAQAIADEVVQSAPAALPVLQSLQPKGERTAYLDEFSLSRAHSAKRLRQVIDASLPDGTAGQLILFLENRCDQACEFCDEPRRSILRRELKNVSLKLQTAVGQDIMGSGAFEALLAELRARSPRLSLMVSGNDWTLHPARDALLSRLAQEREVAVRFHGPHTNLEAPTLVERLKRLPTLDAVHLTLLSSDPSRHDAVTRTPGSGQRVLQAIDNLRAADIRLRLFTVATRTVIEDLPNLLSYLDRVQLRTSLLAFLPDQNWRGWDGRQLMAPMTQIADTLASDPALARRTLSTIDGLPHCAVPESLHDLLCPGGRGHQREASGFAPICDTCRWKPKCDGVTSSYLKAYGNEGLRPPRTEGSPDRPT